MYYLWEGQSDKEHVVDFFKRRVTARRVNVPEDEHITSDKVEV